MAETHSHLLWKEAFDRRAQSYEMSNGGWHAELADDFVKWVDPRPGETSLTLLVARAW